MSETTFKIMELRIIQVDKVVFRSSFNSRDFQHSKNILRFDFCIAHKEFVATGIVYGVSLSSPVQGTYKLPDFAVSMFPRSINISQRNAIKIKAYAIIKW
jgi:hypothetical protein